MGLQPPWSVNYGLEHGIVGGPFNPHAPQVDPAAGLRGLIAGLIVGAALGSLLALGIAAAARQNNRRVLQVGVVLEAVGVVLWALPAWYVPLRVIGVP
jgi:hypothetical protein